MIYTIHQPCYFPWLGLLNKISSSEVLVVMDEVQLSDSAFQHRNQFLTNDGKLKFLTIPFEKEHYRSIPLKELKIADLSWGETHKNFIENNYRKHPFFDQVYPEILPVFWNKSHFLIDIIMDSLLVSMKLFDINIEVVMQSQFDYDRDAKKGDLIIEILKACGADTYLSGKGAEAYQIPTNFDNAGIALRYQNFIHPTYHQKNSKKFVTGLSCLDLLFNVGVSAAFNEIKSGSEQS